MSITSLFQSAIKVFSAAGKKSQGKVTHAINLLRKEGKIGKIDSMYNMARVKQLLKGNREGVASVA